VYVLLRGRVPAAAPLALVVALQQAFVFTRCLFRTALLGSEMALVDRHLPRAAALRPLPVGPPPQPRVEALAEEDPVPTAVAEPVSVAEPASLADENRPR